jgi:hypothetical protein
MFAATGHLRLSFATHGVAIGVIITREVRP